MALVFQRVDGNLHRFIVGFLGLSGAASQSNCTLGLIKKFYDFAGTIATHRGPKLPTTRLFFLQGNVSLHGQNEKRKDNIKM